MGRHKLHRLTPRFKVLLKRSNTSIPTEDNVPYTPLQIKKVLRELYDLPETADIVLDIKRVIPWLSKFHQCVILMYAKTYPITSIQQYYAMYTGGKIPEKEQDKRAQGYRVIDLVVREIMRLMTCDMITVKYNNNRTLTIENGDSDE